MASAVEIQTRRKGACASRVDGCRRVGHFRVDACTRRRIFSNFACLSTAEFISRATSVVVTLTLASRLGVDGYGRIEFAFSVVLWLVFLMRDSSDFIATRELSRHPRLAKPLVDRILAYKGLLGLSLFALLCLIGSWTLRSHGDWVLLVLYGLLLFNMALGLDYVFRGAERMGLVAISLCARSAVYAVGVLSTVHDVSRITWVPLWLTLGELSGLALVWVTYLRGFRWPRPHLSPRFLLILIKRGKTVCLIQLSQAVIHSADLLLVGMVSSWSDVGRYAASHRMVAAFLTFGLIVQQAAFPTLARLWRDTAGAGREALDSLVEVLVAGLVPVAVGCTLLADPLVHLILPRDYAGSGLLLAIGIWRVPLLILAYLYQTTLIALNRESAGVRTLVLGAVLLAPLILVLRMWLGLPGAAVGVLIVGLVLLVAGYASLASEGRQPAWHHHLGRPLAASLVMAPVCVVLARWHVLLGVAGGAGVYLAVWLLLGGMGHTQNWMRVLRRSGARAAVAVESGEP